MASDRHALYVAAIGENQRNEPMTVDESNRDAALPDDRAESNGPDRRSTTDVATESEPADYPSEAPDDDASDDGEDGGPLEDADDEDASAVFARLKAKFEESGFEAL